MVDKTQVIALAFRTAFRTALKIGIHEQVRVLREVIYHARADGKNFFIIALNRAVYLGVADLVEPVTVDAQAKPFRHDFVRCSKIAMDRLAGLLTPTGTIHVLDLVVRRRGTAARLLAEWDRGDYPLLVALART